MLRFRGLPAWVGMAVLSIALTACTRVQYFLANAPAGVGRYDRKTDLRYADDSRQRMDVYSPREARMRPIVVFFYGGHWQDGKKSDYRFVGAALAQRGYVVALPDYRLYPQVKFPAFLEDAAQAVAWVQQHAEQFGGDPQRVVLAGHSAGAHIAAYLAFNRDFLAAAGAQPQAVKGVVGLSGPYALDPNTDILRTIFASPYTAADWQPVRFVDECSPPTLLFHGDRDTVVEVGHTEKLRDALLARHVRVEAEILPGRSHADTVAAFAVVARHRAPVLDRTVAFIDSVSGARVSGGAPSTSVTFSSRPTCASVVPRFPRTGPSP